MAVAHHRHGGFNFANFIHGARDAANNLVHNTLLTLGKAGDDVIGVGKNLADTALDTFGNVVPITKGFTNGVQDAVDNVAKVGTDLVQTAGTVGQDAAVGATGAIDHVLTGGTGVSANAASSSHKETSSSASAS